MDASPFMPMYSSPGASGSDATDSQLKRLQGSAVPVEEDFRDSHLNLYNKAADSHSSMKKCDHGDSSVLSERYPSAGPHKRGDTANEAHVGQPMLSIQTL